MDCSDWTDPLEGVVRTGSNRSSLSSSTVGKNPVELNTEELQVVVDGDSSVASLGPYTADQQRKKRYPQQVSRVKCTGTLK